MDKQTNPTRHKLSKKQLILIVLLVIVIILAGFYLIMNDNSNSQANITANLHTTNKQISSQNSTNNSRVFIMSSRVLNEMVTSPKVRQDLKGDTIYVLISRKNPLSSQTAGLSLKYTQDFTSETTLANHINNLPTNTQAVLYDNEPWKYTPSSQQKNIVSYYQKAYTLAAQHNLQFIATPVIKNKSSITTLADIAKYSNVFDIQSQYDQSSSTTYANHVVPIAKAIKNINPNTIILSGLSTNPKAGVPTSTQLYNDANSVKSYVSGYWLNIPATPSVCRTLHDSTNGRCAGPQPQLGIQFLLKLL